MISKVYKILFVLRLLLLLLHNSDLWWKNCKWISQNEVGYYIKIRKIISLSCLYTNPCKLCQITWESHFSGPILKNCIFVTFKINKIRCHFFCCPRWKLSTNVESNVPTRPTLCASTNTDVSLGKKKLIFCTTLFTSSTLFKQQHGEA